MHNEPTIQRPVVEPDVDLKHGAAFSQLERAFCREYVLNGGNGTAAALAAGYGPGKDSATNAAVRLRTRPRVLAEIKRLSIINTSAHLPVAIGTLLEIATNPKADDRARVQAACALLDRGGLHAKDAPAVAVQVNVTGEQVSRIKDEIFANRLRRLAHPES